MILLLKQFFNSRVMTHVKKKKNKKYENQFNSFHIVPMSVLKINFVFFFSIKSIQIPIAFQAKCQISLIRGIYFFPSFFFVVVIVKSIWMFFVLWQSLTNVGFQILWESKGISFPFHFFLFIQLFGINSNFDLIWFKFIKFVKLSGHLCDMLQCFPIWIVRSSLVFGHNQILKRKKPINHRKHFIFLKRRFVNKKKMFV